MVYTFPRSTLGMLRVKIEVEIKEENSPAISSLVKRRHEISMKIKNRLSDESYDGNLFRKSERFLN